MPPESPAPCYRFGVFEADTRTGELRRGGVRMKLNAQPFQVLAMLLARPGELLTREEIARELWPEGTFVDAEQGVNSAVNRVREALGDTARNPRFVETLARRGYRFLAPVERFGVAAPVAAAVTAAPAAEVCEPAPLVIATPVTMATPVRGRRTWLTAAEDLPAAPHHVVLTLFLLLQGMYLAFYVGALANFGEVEDLLAALPGAAVWLWVTMASAAMLIPLRVFLLCAVLFRPPGLQAKLLRLWPFLLVVDLLWALGPFLLLHHISFGLALACAAVLVYAPFAQRSLVLMGANNG